MEQSTITTEIWARYMDYLYKTALNMRKIYHQRVNKGKQIIDAELDDINKRVHHSLDVIVANSSNVTDNTAPQHESKHRKGKVHLSESQLRNIIKESVKKVMRESEETENEETWWTCWVTSYDIARSGGGDAEMVLVKAFNKDEAKTKAENKVLKRMRNTIIDVVTIDAHPSTSKDFRNYKRGDRFRYVD